MEQDSFWTKKILISRCKKTCLFATNTSKCHISLWFYIYFQRKCLNAIFPVKLLISTHHDWGCFLAIPCQIFVTRVHGGSLILQMFNSFKCHPVWVFSRSYVSVDKENVSSWGRYLFCFMEHIHKHACLCMSPVLVFTALGRDAGVNTCFYFWAKWESCNSSCCTPL